MGLLEAIKSPLQDIIHCRANQKDSSDISKGNNKAAKEAKKATLSILQAPLIPSLDFLPLQYPPSELTEGQNCRFILIPEGWLLSPDDKLHLPDAFQWKILNPPASGHPFRG